MILEAEALSKTIAQVPDELVWMRPAEDPSVAELLWLIHLADEFRFRPVVDAIGRSAFPLLEHVNALVLLETDPAPDSDIGDILDQVASSRRKLVDRLESLPAGSWDGDVLEIEGRRSTLFDLANGIATHDQEILREIGYRLLGSDLSG